MIKIYLRHVLLVDYTVDNNCSSYPELTADIIRGVSSYTLLNVIDEEQRLPHA